MQPPNVGQARAQEQAAYRLAGQRRREETGGPIDGQPPLARQRLDMQGNGSPIRGAIHGAIEQVSQAFIHRNSLPPLQIPRRP